MASEFSFRTRAQALERFRTETFDLLIVGGGITGAAVARDAASRGLKVALIERRDFAWGTSSRSSKLIHGGLRYLENLEFGLVFEALAERAFLLKSVPHMVRPLKFYLPVYEGDPHGKGILGLGLWLYDLLALFRAPEFHKNLSRKALLKDIPFLKAEGLKGGFRYHDASMWDDVLAVQTLHSASQMNAAVANYVEAVEPTWNGERISGFKARDLENGAEFSISAKSTVICAGPWTDEVGKKLSKDWKPWLNPSKGVHLIFDLKRIPIPGALVMSHPEDGRISFVIPRPDFGPGVVIVGTTDSPSPPNPEEVRVDQKDTDYLLALLNRYFPDLKLNASDILSSYVGVRPLFATAPGEALQKVSREHHIGTGPGQTVIVAGGKYTTHRKMGEEIVDFTLRHSRQNARTGSAPAITPSGPSRTAIPVNPGATQDAMDRAEHSAKQEGVELPQSLLGRFGDAAPTIAKQKSAAPDPEGFPSLEAQLIHSIRTEMVIHLEDFYLRRIPLFAARKDHGLPWAERLAEIWAKERALSSSEAQAELSRLKREIQSRAL